MSEQPTPETAHALVALLDRKGTLFEDNAPEELVMLCRRLEIERDELRSDLEFRRNLFQLYVQQLNDVRKERDKFHEDADAFLDKMSKYQERAIDAERKLAATRDLADRLADAAKAVIDQWETPNWRLRESTATYMNTLRNTLAAWKEARSE